MDPFDTSLFEPPPDTGNDDEKKAADPFDIFADDKKAADPFDDIFGDDLFAAAPTVISNTISSNSATSSGKPKVSITSRGSDDLFSLDDDNEKKSVTMATGATSSGRQDLDDLFGPPLAASSALADKSSNSGAMCLSSSSAAVGASLFDDLLDFNSSSAPLPAAAAAPVSLDVASEPQNATWDIKVTSSSSDLLFGGDDIIDVKESVTAVEALQEKKKEHLVQQTGQLGDSLQMIEVFCLYVYDFK
ncbi:hypothetical protein ElyMa_005145300 [Elysia marginata]|uniref:Aftiphilin clathrin-binding box domain-containing protein n=1 Tax=Elysia marginata TaxID=1093978 RepID=A0AAV4JNP9_9GAST|nr:hypothetical protein ElyMa_005145300 [Elysia marginata]